MNTYLKFTLALLACTVLAACVPSASNNPADNSSASSSSPRCPATISIQNFAFNPAECWVDAGDSVTFVNNDQAPHTATADGGAFDTGTLQPGASATVTFDAAGSFPYHCEIHPSMQAVITVRGADGGSTDTSPGSGSGY